MSNIYQKISEKITSGKNCLLATAIAVNGHSPVKVGMKMLFCSGETAIGTIGGGNLEKLVTAKSLQLIAEQSCYTQIYSLNDDKVDEEESADMICGGKVTIFYEFIKGADNICIFGAGHIGKALLHHLKYLPFNVTMYDDRQEYLRECENEAKIVLLDRNSLIKNLRMLAGSCVVIATYSHDFDYEILRTIFETDIEFKYIGIIASVIKAKTILDSLHHDFPNRQFANLYTPIGLSLGGNSPQEIALSIISEIQAVKNQKEVNHLRIS